MNEETPDFLYHLHFNFLLCTQGANVLSLALKTMLELVNMSLCWTRSIKIALLNNNNKPFPFFQDNNLDPA